jgi:hypothetical protein
VVIAAALLAAAAAFAPSYGGRTEEHARLVIETSKSRVVLVHARVDDYECETFGQVGPIRVHARANEKPTSAGRFSFTTGDRAHRVTVRGTITPARATGTIRVRGTIATGRSCDSGPLRFAARPRR